MENHQRHLCVHMHMKRKDVDRTGPAEPTGAEAQVTNILHLGPHSSKLFYNIFLRLCSHNFYVPCEVTNDTHVRDLRFRADETLLLCHPRTQNPGVWATKRALRSCADSCSCVQVTTKGHTGHFSNSREPYAGPLKHKYTKQTAGEKSPQFSVRKSSAGVPS